MNPWRPVQDAAKQCGPMTEITSVMLRGVEGVMGHAGQVGVVVEQPVVAR
jgi:hypothetical protein